MQNKRLLIDLSAWRRARPRDSMKLLLFGLVARDLGLDVLVVDPDRFRRELPTDHPALDLPTWDGKEAWAHLLLCSTLRSRANVDCGKHAKRIVLLQRPHSPDNEKRVLDNADLVIAVKHHHIGRGNLLSVPHIVSERVLDELFQQGLLEAYLADDVREIRSVYEASGERRLAGFIGLADYGRQSVAAMLPPWCSIELHRGDEQPLSAGDYLRWLASCETVLDLPGQHWRTYRFAEAAMMGKPVVCIPGDQQGIVPVDPSNAIVLRCWSDTARFDRLMQKRDAIRATADSAYKEGWSLRSQVVHMLEWFDVPHDDTSATAASVRRADSTLDARPPEHIPYSVKPHRAKRPPRRKYHALVVYDRTGWAYHRRAMALKKHAPPGVLVTTAAYSDVNWTTLAPFNVILLLDYAQTARVRQAITESGWKGTFVVSYSADTRRRQDWWPTVCSLADWVISVSKDRYDARGLAKNVCCISNGVECSQFKPFGYLDDRPHRALWIGTTKAAAEKNWQLAERLIPVAADLGISTDFRLIRHRRDEIPLDRMAEWYNSGSYILCTSSTEGTANTVTEGVACGCIAVTTSVGDVKQWGKAGENCVICEPELTSFAKGLAYAKENRETLAVKGLAAVRGNWDWQKRAPYYFALFNRLLADGPKGCKPFYWGDVKPNEI